MFSANLVILAQMSEELLCGQDKFLEFSVKMAKMTLKVKVNYPYFQYQPREPHDACLVRIWWFQLKSYLVDKFADRGTEGRRQRQYPFALRGLGVKTKVSPTAS